MSTVTTANIVFSARPLQINRDVWFKLFGSVIQSVLSPMARYSSHCNTDMVAHCAKISMWAWSISGMDRNVGGLMKNAESVLSPFCVASSVF